VFPSALPARLSSRGSASSPQGVDSVSRWSLLGWSPAPIPPRRDGAPSPVGLANTSRPANALESSRPTSLLILLRLCSIAHCFNNATLSVCPFVIVRLPLCRSIPPDFRRPPDFCASPHLLSLHGILFLFFLISVFCVYVCFPRSCVRAGSILRGYRPASGFSRAPSALIARTSPSPRSRPQIEEVIGAPQGRQLR